MIWSGIGVGLGVMVLWLILGTAVSVIWVSFFSFSRNEEARRVALATAQARRFSGRRQGQVLRMEAHPGGRYR